MTKIEWTEKTWNPVIGCTKCSPGCENCYAEKMAIRLAHIESTTEKYSKVIGDNMMGSYFWNNEIFCDESVLDKPFHWRKPRKIFVCSMSDLFHPKVPFEFIDKVFAIIILSKAQTSQKYSDRFHIFQLLTKRIRVMLKYYESQPWKRISKYFEHKYNWHWGAGKKWYPENLHLGVSISTQKEADEKIPILLQIPATIRFVSIEPMLEEIEIREHLYRGRWYPNNNPPPRPDWVIVGAESKGRYPGRPCKKEWVDSIVDQCKAANVPVFVKQIHKKGKLIKMSTEYPQEYPND